MKFVNKIKIKGSTQRTQSLLSNLYNRGLSDRTKDWLDQSVFPDIAELFPEEPIIVRRAHAFRIMLETLTDESKQPENYNLYEIFDGELIVGSIPMGSVGLGKVFPRYLTEKERRLSVFTSRDEESMWGHNSPDFEKVLNEGLNKIIEYSFARIQELKDCKTDVFCNKRINFYNAVIICCQAVISYATKYAELAERDARRCSDLERKAELLEIARICRKVPAQKAETFHEALQSIWFIHLALHSTMDLGSLGRLDVLLHPFYSMSMTTEGLNTQKAIELLECFFVKGSSRVNYTTKHLVTQDHMDFGTGLGTNPVFLDQIASSNNFLQNIVVGGVDAEGNDVTNECSYHLLQACSNIGTPTPVLTVRLHKNSPQKFIQAVSSALVNGNNGQPILYNDETIIPGFVNSGIPLKVARDYVVDGCWEPILNAKCDWTFGMINMLTILETAMNSGCLITSNNPSVLRGQKMTYSNIDTNKITSYEQLLESIKDKIRFYTDKVGLGIYDFYNIDASVTPTPFFSALLGNCLEKGLDKTWGGADYIIGGIIAIAIPNAANSLYSIKKIVFEEKRYLLSEFVEILRNNFDGKEEEDLRKEILALPKFGNNEDDVDSIAAWLMDQFSEAIRSAKELADYIYLKKANTQAEEKKISTLRSLAGYEGISMQERFGNDFEILFTSGCGTFGQYASMGKGLAASADGRLRNEPVAPNCSPSSGSVKKGIGHIFSSFEKLKLDRFAAGVVLDLCIEPFEETTYLEAVISDFINRKGNILTISIVDRAKLQEAYNMCEEVRNNLKHSTDLLPFADITVRVGGWNAPFVTLSSEQQIDYLKRHLTK